MTQQFKRPALAGSPSRRAAFTYVGVAQDAQCQRLADRCALVHLKLVERAARAHYLAVAAEAVETGAGTPVEILEQELASLNQQLAQAEADRNVDAEWLRAWQHHLEPAARIANRLYEEAEGRVAQAQREMDEVRRLRENPPKNIERWNELVGMGLSDAQIKRVMAMAEAAEPSRDAEVLQQRADRAHGAITAARALQTALSAWMKDLLRDPEPLRAHPELAPVVAELERLAVEAEAAEAVGG